MTHALIQVTSFQDMYLQKVYIFVYQIIWARMFIESLFMWPKIRSFYGSIVKWIGIYSFNGIVYRKKKE